MTFVFQKEKDGISKFRKKIKTTVFILQVLQYQNNMKGENVYSYR